MTMTFGEMLDRFKELDTIDLIEILDISPEDLVDRFADLIERDPDRYQRELQQWFGDEDELA